METHRGRVGWKSSFTNELDGQSYIVSTIPSRLKGIRVTGKELVGVNYDGGILAGFYPGLEFDVMMQSCIYKLPEKEKIFFINLTDTLMPIQDFHAEVSGLLVRSGMHEMFGASCVDKYEEIGFAAVPAKMGFWRKKQHVFLITKPREES